MNEHFTNLPLIVQHFMNDFCTEHGTTIYNLRNARTEKSKQLRRGLIKALNVRFGKLDDLNKVFGMSEAEMRAV